MAALDEVNVGLYPSKEIVAAALWTWLDENKDTPAFKVNWWVIRKTFTYGDLFPVFELVLGPPPYIHAQ